MRQKSQALTNTPRPTLTPYTWAEKFESFERINSIRETNGNFDPCNSCKRLVPSRLHELHESKLSFVSRIEFIRSKLSNFSAHVYGVTVAAPQRWWPVGSLECRRGMWNGAHVTCQNRPPSPAQTQTQSRRSDRGVGRPSSKRSPGLLYRVQA